MTRWLNIVGVTEEGVDGLSPIARLMVRDARHLIGPTRLLPAPGPRQRIESWTAPLAAMIDQVMAVRGTPTVILASGDPNWFGIGATLSRHLETHEYAMHPAPSSLQLAAARMHWPLQHVTTLSLHGRDIANLHPHLVPGHRILALTGDAAALRDVTDLLDERGFGQSRLTTLENLGGPRERIRNFAASEWKADLVGDFYVLAIDCVADEGTSVLPTVPGLPDSAFVSDGQLTKREVRAATLAKLGPAPGALLWDVGAGCGSVAIEWMRAAPNARAIAFERGPDRCAMIETNRQALGVPDLEIVRGEAPGSLGGAETPDAIFLGGAVRYEGLFEACWRALPAGGRLVANAVTLDGEAALIARQKAHGGELARIEVSSLDRVGDERVLRPRMAVTQWTLVREAT